MLNNYKFLGIGLSSLFLFLGCNNNREKAVVKDTASCESNLPKRFGAGLDTVGIKTGKANHEGMVFIPASEFLMGASDAAGREDEYPQHKVKVDGFWIDITEVTNASFGKFVKETGYITTAERKPDWEELKKQLPPGTPKPPDSVFVAASLVFSAPKKSKQFK